MSGEQHDFGFARSYRIDINPELPSTGQWQLPAFTFGERGNETLTIRVTPDQGQSWVGSFALEIRAGLNGVYACPDPARFIVLTGRDGFLVAADDPGATKKLPIHPTVATTRPVGTNLLLISSFTDVLAVDSKGVSWVTDQLFKDDLEFVDGPAGKILVRGRIDFVPSQQKVLELNPATGRVLR